MQRPDEPQGDGAGQDQDVQAGNLQGAWGDAVPRQPPNFGGGFEWIPGDPRPQEPRQPRGAEGEEQLRQQQLLGGIDGGLAAEGVREWGRRRRRYRIPGPEAVEESVVAGNHRVVPWRDIISRVDRNNIESLFIQDLNFLHVQAYRVPPGEDLGSAIRRHAKVWLEPEAEYFIAETVRFDGPAYVIGNGASIVIECSLGFKISNHDYAPRVPEMEDVVFLNCRFEAGGFNAGRIKAIRADRLVIFQGCVFSGFFKACISARAGARLRACFFLCCHICLLSYYITSSVKQCTFERCVVCLIGQSRLHVRRCMAIECHTFVVFASTGSVSGCMVTGPVANSPMRSIRLSTCICGHPRRLHCIHVVSNRSLPWPSMNSNTFSNLTVYLGNRRGVFHPSATAFQFSVVNVESAARHRVTLTHCYDGFCFVRCIAPVVAEGHEDYPIDTLPCHCGQSHVVCRLRVVDISRFALANRSLVSVNNGDFSSEEEC